MQKIFVVNIANECQDWFMLLHLHPLLKQREEQWKLRKLAQRQAYRARLRQLLKVRRAQKGKRFDSARVSFEI